MSAVALHHVVQGPPGAPPVVLMGSLGSTMAMWEPQIAALAHVMRVVSVDLRGHGGSPVPPGPYVIDDLVDDVVALLDRLGLARVSLVGLSLGGMTALRLAARHPDRVDRLVVLCTSALLGPAAGWTDRAAAVRSGGTKAVAEAVVQRWFTPALREREPALIARMEQMVADTPAEGYALSCEAIAVMDIRADLPRIVAPTLAIAGQDDPATPPPHLSAICKGVASGQLLVIPDAAHLANLEQPVAVTAALLTHLLAPGPDTARRAVGMQVRREVLGSDHVDRSVARTSPFTADFQDFITRSAWGDVWSRPGLSRRSRSMLTLALLAGLGHEAELALHVRAALTNGLTADEIGEVLLHTAVYAGVPAANSAFTVAQRVLAQDGVGATEPVGSADGQGDLPGEV